MQYILLPRDKQLNIAALHHETREDGSLAPNMHVLRCILGNSRRWIKQHSENVSSYSECNIIIICDACNSCYKCMFSAMGICMHVS